MSVLSVEDIQNLLSESRTRGGYAQDLKEFFKSGALAIDFTVKYPTKESNSLRNSVKQNIDKIRSENGNVPDTQIVLAKNDDDKAHVIVINMDTYKLQAASTDEA